jgi:hypothetical protein
MTVLRREDVQSRVASWDGCPYRIASSPILAIVPLIIRRLRGPSPSRVIVRSIPLHRRVLPLLRRYRRWLQCRPQEAGQLARDRHRDLRRWLVFCRQFAEAPTQSLLRLIRNRNHAARLAFASPREGDADARPVLIVPGGFHQQPTHQRVAGSRDAAAPVLLPAGVLARHQPEVRHQRRRRGESSKVMQLGEDQHRGQCIDAAETAQPPDRLPIRLALGNFREPGIQLQQARFGVIDRQLRPA